MTDDDEMELRRLLLVAVHRSNREQAQCAGKFPHQTYQAAVHSMRRMEKGKPQAYRCDCCGCWHVGGQNIPKSSRKHPKPFD